MFARSRCIFVLLICYVRPCLEPEALPRIYTHVGPYLLAGQAIIVVFATPVSSFLAAEVSFLCSFCRKLVPVKFFDKIAANFMLINVITLCSVNRLRD